MADDRDLAVIAGEYVIGTLDPLERGEVDKERRRHAALDRAITVWEARLLHLTDSIPPVEPPLQLWNRIEAQLAPSQAVARLPVAAESRPPPQPAAPTSRTPELWFWRGYGLIVSLIAIAACCYIHALTYDYRDDHPRPTFKSFLGTDSQINNQANNPGNMRSDGRIDGRPDKRTVGMTASVDLPRRLVTIKLTNAPPPGGVYQLWLVGDDQSLPRSLGLMNSRQAVLKLDPAITLLRLQHSDLAISAEAADGSITGLPSGPYVAKGRANLRRPAPTADK